MRRHESLGKGGWILVVRDRGRSGPGRWEGSAGVFNVFVDNLPASLNPKGLYNLFAKFGVVMDVFIPQKRRRLTNTRFGFVRFGCSVVANIAVQKAHGLWLDDRTLQVKHAEYGKVTIRGEAKKRPLRNQVRGSIVYADKEGDVPIGCSGLRDRRSYVDAVASKRGEGGGGIVVKAEEVGNGWLFESIIIRLKVPYVNISLKKEIAAIGVEDVMVRDSGGRDVVITFNSKEERALKFPAIKELIGDWCEEITEGKPGQVLEQERSVWLSCYGIPLHLWNSYNIRKIGEVWGQVLCLEGVTSQPLTFVCAKVKISTKSMESINSAVNLECRGRVFPVKVCEEQVINLKSGKCSCRCHKVQHVVEIGSSNVMEDHIMNVEDEDADVEDDSADEMEVGCDVDQIGRPNGEKRSEEVDNMEGRRSVEEDIAGRSDGVNVEATEGDGLCLPRRGLGQQGNPGSSKAREVGPDGRLSSLSEAHEKDPSCSLRSNKKRKTEDQKY
ncbi:hypothetical protein ACSBR1_017214 [Camellia fascicularis]